MRTQTDLPHTSGPQKEFSIERFPPLKLCSSGGQRGLSAGGQVWGAGVCLPMNVWAGGQAGLITSAIDLNVICHGSGFPQLRNLFQCLSCILINPLIPSPCPSLLGSVFIFPPKDYLQREFRLSIHTLLRMF